MSAVLQAKKANKKRPNVRQNLIIGADLYYNYLFAVNELSSSSRITPDVPATDDTIIEKGLRFRCTPKKEPMILTANKAATP